MCWHPTRWVPAEGRHGRATGRSRCRTRWRCSNRSFRVRATPSRWSGILTAPRRRWWQSSRSRIACGPWRCTSPRFSRCSTPNRRSERGRRDLSRRGCRRCRSRCRRPGPRHRMLHRLLDGTRRLASDTRGAQGADRGIGCERARLGRATHPRAHTSGKPCGARSAGSLHGRPRFAGRVARLPAVALRRVEVIEFEGMGHRARSLTLRVSTKQSHDSCRTDAAPGLRLHALVCLNRLPRREPFNASRPGRTASVRPLCSVPTSRPADRRP